MIALLAAFTAISFAACNREENTVSPDNEAENANGEAVYDENGEIVKDDSYYFSDLSDDYFEGYNYRILVRQTHHTFL